MAHPITMFRTTETPPDTSRHPSTPFTTPFIHPIASSTPSHATPQSLPNDTLLDSISLPTLKQILAREKALLMHSKREMVAYLPAYEKLREQEKSMERKLREIEDYIEVMGKYNSNADDSMLSPSSAMEENGIQDLQEDEEGIDEKEEVSTETSKKRKSTAPAAPTKKKGTSPTTGQRKRSSSDTPLTQYGFTSHRQQQQRSRDSLALTSPTPTAATKGLSKQQLHFYALHQSIAQMSEKLERLHHKKDAKLQYLADLEQEEAEGHLLLEEQLYRAQLLQSENTVYSVQLEFAKLENDILTDEKRRSELSLLQHRTKLRKVNTELGVWKTNVSSQSEVIENLEKEIEKDEALLKRMQEQVRQMSAQIEIQNLTLKSFSGAHLRRILVDKSGKVVAKDDTVQITLLKNPSTKKLFIDLEMQDLDESGQPKSDEPLHICYALSEVKQIRRRSPQMFSLHLMSVRVLHFETDTPEQSNEIVQAVQDLLNEVND